MVIFFDYFLYWAILLSRKHSGSDIEVNQDVDIGVNVQDGGLLSEFLQRFVGNLRTQSNVTHTIDMSVCIPEGSPPDLLPIFREL